MYLFEELIAWLTSSSAPVAPVSAMSAMVTGDIMPKVSFPTVVAANTAFSVVTSDGGGFDANLRVDGRLALDKSIRGSVALKLFDSNLVAAGPLHGLVSNGSRVAVQKLDVHSEITGGTVFVVLAASLSPLRVSLN